MTEMPWGGLNQSMGIVLVEATPDRVVCTMPVEGNTQPYGLLHGGASCVLAETIGSIGSLLGGNGRLPVGVDINATHHRAATSGTVTGVGTPLYAGRSIATWQITITDEQERLICTARITCALREA